MKDIQITVETTPNPQALKFLVNQTLTDEPYEANDIQQAQKHSPLAYKILSLPWVINVFIGKDFITITKEDWVEWEPVKTPLTHMIKQSLEIESPVLKRKKVSPEKQGDIVEKIKLIIDKDIQPAVQRDGGFIQFSDFKDGKLYVELKGACSGCPSAEITLKQGIEHLIQQEIPEVQEVISIN